MARLKLYLSMIRYANAHNKDFAREHYEFFCRMQTDMKSYFPDLRPLRVLDVGCGQRMWLTLLLHSSGARVTGIDAEPAQPRPSLRKYWGILRTNGLERTVRTVAWDLLYARPYYAALAALCPFPLRFDGVDTRPSSITQLDFEDDTFDFVVSHEVFEHLPDVPGALRALGRAMKPDALTYIYTHNYTSVSGGHHIAWKYPDSEPSTVVPPWDHLRQNIAPEIPSWINRWRECQYREAFQREFEILEWIHTEREGAKLLTPEIRRELHEYEEEELLAKGFLTIARPLKSGHADGSVRVS